MKAILLAAGKGSRISKTMIILTGVPLLAKVTKHTRESRNCMLNTVAPIFLVKMNLIVVTALLRRNIMVISL